VPLSRRELGPRLTQRGLGRGLLPYQVASSSIQPFGYNRHEWKTGGCAPFRGGAATPSNTTSPGPNWHLDPSSHLATIDMGQKLGWGCALFFWGSWVPIEHKVAWAKAYLHTKWHLSPSSHLATMDIGRKLGGCAPLGEGRWDPSNIMSPGPRPACVPSGIVIHPAAWPQQTWAEIGGSVPFLGRGWVPI